MKGDTGKTASAPAFVLCPPGCADEVRRALPPGCDLVVAGSPEEARAAFAARTGAAAPAGGAGEMTLDGRTVDLTALERAVYEVLSSRPGRSFSRAELLRAIHGSQAGSVRLRAIDATVSGLRRKLGPSGWRVQTVWGRGYRWNAGGGPSSSPFATALRWSAGTLGVFVLAALLVARPRPEEPAPPVAEPAPPVIEAPVAAEPSAGDVGDIGDIGDDGDADPDSLAELSVAEPALKPAPASSVKRAASAPAAGRAAAACAPAPVSAVVLPPDDTLAPKDGFEIHVMTAEDRTLSNLARSRGITLAELLAANPQIADPDLVRAGQPIYVPASGSAPER